MKILRKSIKLAKNSVILKIMTGKREQMKRS
jgi:hypothetical protein